MWDEILLPILFGHVGASIDLKKINLETIWISTSFFLCAEVLRFVGAFLTGYLKGYTFRERLFLATSWMPKGAKTVTLGFTLFPLVLQEV